MHVLQPSITILTVFELSIYLIKQLIFSIGNSNWLLEAIHHLYRIFFNTGVCLKKVMEKTHSNVYELVEIFNKEQRITVTSICQERDSTMQAEHK